MALAIALKCDIGTSPDCLHFSAVFPTRKGSRNAAYRAGWKREGQLDVCPKCYRKTLSAIKESNHVHEE